MHARRIGSPCGSQASIDELADDLPKSGLHNCRWLYRSKLAEEINIFLNQ